MAPVVPQSRTELIAWYAQRSPVWATGGAAIGLTVAQITTLAALLATAETAEASAFLARDESRAATTVYYNETDALAAFGAGLVKTIKAFAEATEDPNVYAEALIPPPAPPTPAGPPDQPTDLSADLLPGGGIRLAWKGSVSQGAYFSVFRRLEGQSTFSILKSPKVKSYDDTTIPAGTTGVEYFIQAVRDEFTVDSGWLQVNFGVGGATVTTISMAA